MIIITGAAGFIGSCVASAYASRGDQKLVLVDDFSRNDKLPNHVDLEVEERVERSQFFEWVEGKEDEISGIIHLGARTDTAEMDERIFDRLNLHYSKEMWDLCTIHMIPLIYASSAATYGSGEHGFADDESRIPLLAPLNPYGESKQNFDLWVLDQTGRDGSSKNISANQYAPPFWAGLKFFNVYGPNEYHKGRMASVIFHAYNQIKETGKMKLFRSHHEDYRDGEQMRDFVYVMDVVKVILDLMDNQRESGIYNLGSGTARTFNDLVTGVFNALDLPVEIEYIDTPEDIRDKYQYFTEATMEKLKKAGGFEPDCSLEDGIKDYVQNYLIEGKIF